MSTLRTNTLKTTDDLNVVAIADLVPAVALRSDLSNTADIAKGAGQIARGDQIVNSITELRALLKISASKFSFVNGYYAAGDGGGGPYYLDAADTTSADNGGTIIVATDGGRWKLIHNSVISVKQFGCKGDGVTSDTVRLQAAVDAIGVLTGVLFFPVGNYLVDATVTLKNGVIYEGAGVDINGKGTKITYTGTADAFKISNPINSSTSANIEIRGIWFSSTTLTVDNALLFDTGSSVVIVRRCRFNSSGVGIILDQSELFDIELCSFNATSATSTGIWLVNGADKNVGALTYFTNRIGVRSCDFNGAAGAVAIYDDGGTVHTFENNNFNACGSHIIATGVNGLKIDGGEFEISSAQSIIIGLTKRKGAAGLKTLIASINRVFIFNNVNQPAFATVANATGKLEFTNNFLNTVAGTTLSGITLCDEIVAYGNQQAGAGDTGAAINNYIDNLVTTTAWTSSGSAPSLGNGALAAHYSRRGKRVSYRLKLVYGSTTSGGTGVWTFTLPIAANMLGQNYNGAAYILIAGSSHYTATAIFTTDGTGVQIAVVNANLVGQTVPAAFVTDSKLEFQVEYDVASPI